MNCLKDQRERFSTTESWSPPPHVAYQPLRVSRSVAPSNLHSLGNSRFSRGFSNECRPLPTAGGFSSFDDDDKDYLLKDSQVSMDSTVQCHCKCGHKKLEVSYPRRSRSFLGYLPEVQEEMRIHLPRDLHGVALYLWTRISGTLILMRAILNSSTLILRVSDWRPLAVYRISPALTGVLQRPRLEEEILVTSSLSRCTLDQTRHRGERRMLLSTPEKFRCINQEGSDNYNGGISFDPMSTFRNLRYGGTQLPGHEVQFRNRQGAFMPSIIRPKQTMGNSSLEVPSSSCVSASSDETEHPGDHPQLKVGLYKTELCRSWPEETGFCRYGAMCQFAYEYDDLRPVPRHPKYKTEALIQKRKVFNSTFRKGMSLTNKHPLIHCSGCENKSPSILNVTRPQYVPQKWKLPIFTCPIDKPNSNFSIIPHVRKLPANYRNF